MNLDNPFDERQPNARAFTLRVEFVEETKDLILELRWDAHAVVTNIKNWLAILFPLCTNLDCRLCLIIHKFCGIINQVLKDLKDALAITINDGQSIHNFH